MYLRSPTTNSFLEADIADSYYRPVYSSYLVGHFVKQNDVRDTALLQTHQFEELRSLQEPRAAVKTSYARGSVQLELWNLLVYLVAYSCTAVVVIRFESYQPRIGFLCVCSAVRM